MNKQQLELGLKIKGIIGDGDLDNSDNLYRHEMDSHVYDLKEESEGDWISEGKYEYRETVVEVLEDRKETGIYLRQNQSRSGSHFTDWYYQNEKCELVERYEEVVKVVKYKSICVK